MQWKEFKEEICSFLEKRHGLVRSCGKSLWGYFFCPFFGVEPVFLSGLTYRKEDPRTVEEEGLQGVNSSNPPQKGPFTDLGDSLGTAEGPLSMKGQALRATRLTSSRSVMMMMFPSTRMRPSFSMFASSRDRDGRCTPSVSAQYFLVKGISTTRLPLPE